MDIIRRRALYEAKMDEYVGCDFGVTVVRNVVEFPPCLLPLVAIPSNCTSITLRHYIPSAGVSAIIEYNGSSASNNITTNTANERTATLTAGVITNVRCLINLDYIDDCYLKDNTNNTYLWKGNNIT